MTSKKQPFNIPPVNLPGSIADRMRLLATALAAGSAQQQSLADEVQVLEAGAPPPPPPASYTVTAGVADVDEGGAAVFTVQGSNVSPGTTLTYVLRGAAGALDVSVALAGVITLDAALQAVVTVPIVADLATEGDELLEFALQDGLGVGVCTIKDTSVEPPAPTWTVTASVAALDEGASVTFLVTTTGVAPGIVVGYMLAGAAQAADVSVPTVGELTIGADGTASLVVPTIADLVTEGDEMLEFVLAGGLGLAAALIRDTSQDPPPPPPDPAAPPFPVNVPQVRSINSAAVIHFLLENGGTLAYARWQDMPPIRTDTYAVTIQGGDHTTNLLRALSASSYALLVDGVVHATIGVPAGAKTATFTLRSSELADGWHWLDLAAASAETTRPWWVRVQRGPLGAQAWMPVVHSSYDSAGHLPKHGASRFALVPARFAPRMKPVPVRAMPPITTAIGRAELYMLDLVPERNHDIYRPRRDLDTGVLHAANVQNYTFSGMTSRASSMALLDGPRGMGSAAMVTHIQPGRNGKVYACDPFRVFSIAVDGTIKTLAGYRHAPPAQRSSPVTTSSAMASYELVGDWNGVATGRPRGFHELWGLSWDERTVQQGSGPPVPNPPRPDEPAHDIPPVMFVADSQNNRVCRIEFSPVDHAVPAKITEYIVGLLDPWDVRCTDGKLYVSERGAHRILEYGVPLDGSPPTLLRTLASGAPLAHIDDNRRVLRDASLAAIRAEACVLPEGLFDIPDGAGGWWLYFGSLAMAQVKRIHLTTGELQVVVPDAYWDAGSNFLKIAVSSSIPRAPGGVAYQFGPHGSVFVQSFAANSPGATGGMPAAYLPGGALWNFNPGSQGGQGPGLVWESKDYGCSVGVGDGCLMIGSSIEWVGRISRALPGDAVILYGDQKAATDHYNSSGLPLVHGPGGWDYTGVPHPWGVHPLVDAHLLHHGWTPGD